MTGGLRQNRSETFTSASPRAHADAFKCLTGISNSKKILIFDTILDTPVEKLPKCALIFYYNVKMQKMNTETISDI